MKFGKHASLRGMWEQSLAGSTPVLGTTMKTKQDTSYGVIPYIKENNELKFFLIHQYSPLRKDTYWVFPKGHPEEGETGEDTARRELEEETQIKLESLDAEHTFKIEYNFVHENVRIEKSVIFFLGLATSKDYVLEEREVKDAGWYTYKEAREKITFENTKKLLDEVIKYLE